MKTQLLSFVLALTSTLAFSQPEDARHKREMEQQEKDMKAYNKEYIDALRYNRNTPSKSSSGSSSSSASQDLADIFAARAGRETSAQKAARLKENKARYQEYQKQEAAFREAYFAKSAAETRARNIIYEPRFKEYLSAGFHPWEAGRLGDSHVDAKLTPDRQSTIYSPAFPSASIRAREAFLEYKQKKQTAGFEELFDLITDFNVAPYSAKLALQDLEKRFPEKKELIDLSYPYHTASVWGRYQGGNAKPIYYFAPDSIKNQMIEIFEKALRTQPEAAMFIAAKANYSYNPIKLVVQRNSSKAFFPEAVRLVTTLLKTTPDGPLDLFGSKFQVRGYSFIFKNPMYRANAADIKAIADVHKVLPRLVVEWMNDVDDGRFTKAYLSTLR